MNKYFLQGCGSGFIWGVIIGAPIAAAYSFYTHLYIMAVMFSLEAIVAIGILIHNKKFN